MTLVTRNVAANYAGKAWVSVMALAFIPVYVRLLGVESYALIGVFASLVALISLLDMGLSSTLSRELSRAAVSPSPDAVQESRDLLRTLEAIYWGVGALIGVVVGAGAPLLARYWFTTTGIDEGTVAKALAMMGLVIAVQWPSSLYDGGLTGLQRQVLLNVVRAAIATAQHGGAVLILLFVSPSIVAYFTWQVAVNVASTLVLRRLAWRALPGPSSRGSFVPALLRRVWWFAAGMTGISVMTILLTQADKVVLTRLLPLEIFGYYVIASNVASVIVHLVSPLYYALLPRFTQLFAAPEAHVDLSTLYHFACQCVAVLVLPAAAVLAFYPEEVLLIWIRNPVVARGVAPIARLLVIGQALNALLFIPSLVQIAYGWTRLIFFTNVANVVVLVPLIVALVLSYGVVGGAATWIIVNASYFFGMIPLLHRRLLTKERQEYYRRDVIGPILAVAVAGAASRALMPHLGSEIATVAWIAGSGGVALVAAAVAMPHTRAWVRRVVAGLS